MFMNMLLGMAGLVALVTGTVTYTSTGYPVGYISGSQGSISLSSSTLGGATINVIEAKNVAQDFQIGLSGTVALAGLFSLVQVQDDSGAVRNYTFAAQTQPGPNVSILTWGDGTNPPWLSSTAKTRTFAIYA